MKILFLIISCLLLISCSSTDKQPSVPDTSLTNTRWVLRALNDKKIFTPEGKREITLILNSSENKAAIYGGCNNFFSQFTVNTNQLKFGIIAGTEMFCENAMETESEFIKALTNTTKYNIKGNDLYLYDSVKVFAKFEAVYLK